MDPAESVVELWLQNQGYFTRNGVEVGHKGMEIDFLAYHAGTNKRLHVESHVSVNPFGTLRPWGPIRNAKMPLNDRVRLYFEKKFIGSVDEKSHELLDKAIEKKALESFDGKSYEKWLVLGEQNEDPEALRREFAKHGVEVHFMDEILKEIRFTGTPKGDTARFVQILARYGSEASKKNLVHATGGYQKGKSCGRGNHHYDDFGSYVKCSVCGSSKTI
jgi:hypothetical protein